MDYSRNQAPIPFEPHECKIPSRIPVQWSLLSEFGDYALFDPANQIALARINSCPLGGAGPFHLEETVKVLFLDHIFLCKALVVLRHGLLGNHRTTALTLRNAFTSIEPWIL